METTALSAIRFGLDASWKVTILLALVLALIVGLRRASAAVRHMAAALGLAGALALPVVALFVPRVSIPLLPSFLPEPAAAAAAPRSAVPAENASRSADRRRAAASEAGDANATTRGSAPRALQEPLRRSALEPLPLSAKSAVSPALSEVSRAATKPGARTTASFAWAPWALAVWAAGTLLASARLLLGSLRVRAIAREGEPLHDREWLDAAADVAERLSLKSRVRILTSADVPVAMTAGARRPVLLLNASARKWPADRRRVVLLHELAHVRRRDWITLLLCEVAVAVYWFHPLAWLARREARLNGERACDDLVIGDGTKPSVYAAHLLGIVRSFSPGARTALPVMAMARPSQFEGRMRAILDPGLHRRGPSGGQVRAAALGLFTSVVVLAALQPWAPRKAEGAAIPGGLDSSAGVFPANGERARAKTPCKQAALRPAPKNGCPRKAASGPTTPATAPLIAFAPPVVDPSGFVKALARIATPAPEAAPRTETEVRPVPAVPASAPLPAGIVLASNRHERSGEDWYDRGMTLHHSGHYDAAIAAFGKAIELGYREDAATYNTACAYALKGDKDHAFEWLRKAMDAGFSVSNYLGDDDDLESLRSDPRYAALKSEARAHRGTKEIEAARAASARYERLIARAKNPKGAFFSSGHDLLKASEYALAAKAFHRSAELGYRSGTSYYNEACALALAGEKTSALDALQKSLENGFDDPSMFQSDDDLESLHGDARFQKLETLAEDLQMPTVRWGSKLLRSSERRGWREAATEARRVAARYPNMGRSWFNLGYTELRAERPEAAADAFQKALQLSYRKPTTLYNLACSYAKAGQKEKAFEFLFQAIDAGFDEGSTLAHDEDLDNLHGDARFRTAERKLDDRSNED